MSEPVTLGILLASAEPGRVHAALAMAASGAALNRRVVLLATGAGVQALAAGNPFDPATEARLSAVGVATCRTLRDAALELGARMLACDAAVRVEGVVDLQPGVAVAGMATFLAETAGAQTLSF